MSQDWRKARDEALLHLERAKRPSERTAAAEAVVAFGEGHPDRWDELAAVIPRLLADAQEEVRRGGVRLGAMLLHPDEAETFLTARLQDPSALVRMEAAGQLADLVRPTARGALAAALRDSAFAVRFEAARGMAALKHSSGLEVLLEGLEKNDLRFRALGALGELGDPKALPNVRTIFRRWLLNVFERTQAAAVLARLGDPEGSQYLLERTRARRAVDRAMAIELLGELRPPGGLERLRELVEDPKDPGRGAAARGLGRTGNDAAIPLLETLAREPATNDDLTLDALEGLAHLALPRALALAEEVGPRLSAAARDELQRMLRDFQLNEEEHP